MTVEMISHLLEALMILCFGLSWPLSIYKSWTSRTAKGKSLYFEVFIWIGYIFGIANKFISYMNNPDKDWIFFLAWAFYFLNIAEITVDMVLYFRNVKLEKRSREIKQRNTVKLTESPAVRHLMRHRRGFLRFAYNILQFLRLLAGGKDSV